jgi:hypothetical protein
MLRTLGFNIAHMWFWCCVEGREEGPWCWMLQTLIFNVVDVDFRCCRHVMLGVVSRRRNDEGSWCWMLHATHVATWVTWVLCLGRKAPDVGCYTQHVLQHGSLYFDLTADGWVASNPTTTEESDANPRNGRPSTSSSLSSPTLLAY